MKKSSWVLLLVFAILATFTYFYLNKPDDTRTGKEFALQNTAQIGKIVMWDKMKRRATLTREDGHWQINGKYRARQRAVDLLLETFNNIHVTAQVPRTAEERVRRSINVNGIITEIYNKQGKPLKTLYVGEGTPGSQGTYMMQKGDKYPYEVGLPNWTGVLKPRFMLNETDWRDRAVFRYPSKDIQSVTVEYSQPDKKELSFKIDRDRNNFTVKKLYGLPETRSPIKAKTLYFLKGFEELIAEAFETKNPKRDVITKATPFCEITLVTTKGEEKNVKFYPVPGRKIGETEKGDPIRANIEKYFVSINDNEDFMLVQDRLFSRVLAPSNFFFEKED